MEGRTLVWVDESGFYLLPAVQRGYGPKGRTLVLRHTLSNDHLSAISAITPDDCLYMQVQKQAFRSEEVVRFLEHLLCHIPGKLLIIWDRSPIHRSKVIKEFLSNGQGHVKVAGLGSWVELLPAGKKVLANTVT